MSAQRNDITGSTVPFVKEIQIYLRFIQRLRTGSTYVPYDGIFGQKTTRAVREFQRDYGLKETGIVEALTWQRLYEVYQEGINQSAIPLPIPGLPQGSPILRQGAKGDDVAFLQIMLRRLGLLYGNVDAEPAPSGTYTAATRQAVGQIQRQVGLPQTGDTDKATWDAITTLYSQYNGGNL